MSSFQVAESTLSAIASVVFADPYLTDRFRTQSTALATPDGLVTALAQLNDRALTARYGGTRSARRVRYDNQPQRPLVAYVALRCFLYQCAEGTVPRSPLYRLLAGDLQTTLADRIIRALPAYEQAAEHGWR